MPRATLPALALIAAAASGVAATPGERALRTPEYRELQKRVARGWNTWNTNSVLSHVHLPEGFAITFGLKSAGAGPHYQRDFFPANETLKRPERMRLGPHADDGSYTELVLEWQSDDRASPYNAITGAGNDVTSSDAFYHWGALLGVISLLEQGR